MLARSFFSHRIHPQKRKKEAAFSGSLFGENNLIECDQTYGLIGVATGCGLSIPGVGRTGVSVVEFDGGLPSGTG